MFGKVGILGGSFDPIHYGHLWIANHAFEQLHLDSLRIIPAAQSPLKPINSHADARCRLEMTQLAISGIDQWTVDDCEIQRGGTSFTLDTVLHLRRQFPGNQWYLIVGADSVASLPLWHQPEELLRCVTLAAVQRASDPPIDYGVIEKLADAEVAKKCRSAAVTMPLISLSSSEIRRRIAAGRNIRFMTPSAVQAYIASANLYRHAQ